MLVVGDREVEGGTVAVRHRRGGDQGSSSVEAFLGEAKKWIDGYNLEP